MRFLSLLKCLPLQARDIECMYSVIYASLPAQPSQAIVYCCYMIVIIMMNEDELIEVSVLKTTCGQGFYFS